MKTGKQPRGGQAAAMLRRGKKPDAKPGARGGSGRALTGHQRLLLLMVVVLVVCIGLGGNRMWHALRQVQRSPSPPASVSLEPAPQPTAPDERILARNLMDLQRTKEAAAQAQRIDPYALERANLPAPPPPPPPEPPAPQAPSWDVVGIIQNHKACAFVLFNNRGHVVFLHEEFMGWRLVAIEGAQTRWRQDGQTKEVTLLQNPSKGGGMRAGPPVQPLPVHRRTQGTGNAGRQEAFTPRPQGNAGPAIQNWQQTPAAGSAPAP